MTARDFSAEHARRKALVSERGFSSYNEQRRTSPRINSRADIAALPPAAQLAREEALDAVAIARRTGASLPDAARQAGTTVGSVRFWAADALETPNRVAPADRMFRSMYVYSGGLRVDIDTRGSRVSSKIGQYHDAIRRFRETGDATALSRFTGVKIAGVELETNPETINEMGRRNMFDVASIYAEVI